MAQKREYLEKILPMLSLFLGSLFVYSDKDDWPANKYLPFLRVISSQSRETLQANLGILQELF